MTVQDPMASVYHRCSFSSRRVASLESAAAVSNRRPQSRIGGRSLEPRAAMAAVGAVGSRAERESCPGTAALVLARTTRLGGNHLWPNAHFVAHVSERRVTRTIAIPTSPRARRSL